MPTLRAHHGWRFISRMMARIEIFRQKGFYQVAIRADRFDLLSGRRRGVPGHHNDEGVRCSRITFEPAGRFPAIHARHREIENDYVRTLVVSFGEPLDAVPGRVDSESTERQVLGIHLAGVLGVVDDQDGDGNRRAGHQVKVSASRCDDNANLEQREREVRGVWAADWDAHFDNGSETVAGRRSHRLGIVARVRPAGQREKFFLSGSSRTNPALACDRGDTAGKIRRSSSMRPVITITGTNGAVRRNRRRAHHSMRRARRRLICVELVPSIGRASRATGAEEAFGLGRDEVVVVVQRLAARPADRPRR